MSTFQNKKTGERENICKFKSKTSPIIKSNLDIKPKHVSLQNLVNLQNQKKHGEQKKMFIMQFTDILGVTETKYFHT